MALDEVIAEIALRLRSRDDIADIFNGRVGDGMTALPDGTFVYDTDEDELYNCYHN